MPICPSVALGRHRIHRASDRIRWPPQRATAYSLECLCPFGAGVPERSGFGDTKRHSQQWTDAPVSGRTRQSAAAVPVSSGRTRQSAAAVPVSSGRPRQSAAAVQSAVDGRARQRRPRARHPDTARRLCVRRSGPTSLSRAVCGARIELGSRGGNSALATAHWQQRAGDSASVTASWRQRVGQSASATAHRR